MIDMEKVIKDLEFCVNGHFKVELSLATKILAILKEQEAVVRCKDCKHWDADEHDCNIKIGWFACGADWFCADGERK